MKASPLSDFVVWELGIEAINGRGVRGDLACINERNDSRATFVERWMYMRSLVLILMKKERKKVADRFLILKSGRTGLWYQP